MIFLRKKEYRGIDKQTRKSLDYSIADGAAWSAMFTLTSGVFLIGFALLLGATSFQIGLISSLPFLATAAQIIGAYFIENTGEKKMISIVAALVNRMLWILIILTPFFVFPPTKAIWVVIVIFALSNVFASISGVAWLSWMSSLLPRNILGKFFSTRNTYIGFVSVVVGLLGGFFLDYWKINQPVLLNAFVILFLTAVLFGLIGIFYQRRVREAPKEEENATFQRFINLAKLPYKDPSFKRLLIFGIMWGFALGIVGPFFVVYELKILNLSYMMIVILDTLFVVTGIASLRKWGDAVDQFGAKPVLMISSFVVSLYPLFFLFITRENFMLLAPLNILAGIAWSGVDFSSAQILLRTSPQYNKSIYFSSFAAASGIALGISPIIGGFLVGVFENISLPLFFLAFSGLHLLFLMSGILRLWSTSLIPLIDEPESGGVDEVLSTLKSSRLMNLFVNYYYVSKFSIGVVTLPLVYTRRVFKESERLFIKEVGKFRASSMKILKEIDGLVKMSVNEMTKVKYDSLKELLPHMNILNRQVKTLKSRIATVEDGKVKRVVADDMRKLEKRVNLILEGLKSSKELARMPGRYMKRLKRLVGNVVKVFY